MQSSVPGPTGRRQGRVYATRLCGDPLPELPSLQPGTGEWLPNVRKVRGPTPPVLAIAPLAWGAAGRTGRLFGLSELSDGSGSGSPITRPNPHDAGLAVFDQEAIG